VCPRFASILWTLTGDPSTSLTPLLRALRGPVFAIGACPERSRRAVKSFSLRPPRTFSAPSAFDSAFLTRFRSRTFAPPVVHAFVFLCVLRGHSPRPLRFKIFSLLTVSFVNVRTLRGSRLPIFFAPFAAFLRAPGWFMLLFFSASSAF
jgi:hypothetical protein